MYDQQQYGGGGPGKGGYTQSGGGMQQQGYPQGGGGMQPQQPPGAAGGESVGGFAQDLGLGETQANMLNFAAAAGMERFQGR